MAAISVQDRKSLQIWRHLQLAQVELPKANCFCKTSEKTAFRVRVSCYSSALVTIGRTNQRNRHLKEEKKKSQQDEERL